MTAPKRIQRRRAAGVFLALLASVVLTGCEESSSAYRERDRQRYHYCVEHGGSYSVEDTSVGEHWTCTMRDRKDTP